MTIPEPDSGDLHHELTFSIVSWSAMSAIIPTLEFEISNQKILTAVRLKKKNTYSCEIEIKLGMNIYQILNFLSSKEGLFMCFRA
jgi:hypothetical protein